MEYNQYQLAIFEEVRSGSGNVVVESDAGVGKTLCIEHSIPHIPPLSSWIVVAFTKKVAQEMKKRVEGEIYNLHALGLKYIFRAFPKIKVNPSKVTELLEQKFPGKATQFWELRARLATIVSLCKFNLAWNTEEIRKIIDDYDLDLENLEDFNISSLEESVHEILQECKQDIKQVDQDDMIWFPNVWADRIKLDTYDYVFGDEAQDFNKAQIAILLRLAGKNGRIFAFGSEKQSLFRFCGADENAIKNIIEATNAKVMSLPISYRCSKAVIKEASKIFSGIMPSENSKEGKIEYISYRQMINLAQHNSFILGRINAPLIGIALELLRKQKPCLILGRKFGQDLNSLIRKSRTKSIDKFLLWLERWSDKEVNKLIKKNKDTTEVIDKVECLKVLCENASDLSDLGKLISKLFEDKEDSSVITLSSVHRAKGGERPVVFILKWTLRSSKDPEEARIRYVAVTRSMLDIYYVDKPE